MSDFGPFTRTAFPDGSEVYYRDENHSYWRGCRENPKADCGYSGSGRLTGISTVAAPFDWRPDNLMRWTDREADAEARAEQAEKDRDQAQKLVRMFEDSLNDWQDAWLAERSAVPTATVSETDIEHAIWAAYMESASTRSLTLARPTTGPNGLWPQRKPLPPLPSIPDQEMASGASLRRRP